MTQEELDALMAGELDGLDDISSESVTEKAQEEELPSQDDIDMEEEYKSYRPDSKKSWPPPPPTDDHKVVNQLDDVTRDSEVKATELLEKIETIMDFFGTASKGAKSVKATMKNQVELFTTLSEKFPNVQAFKTSLEECQGALDKIDEIMDNLAMGEDEAMMAMDAMQYQDIHRQKIERVINVMRALSKYMNSLFEGRIDDEKRVSSAVHIEGDNTADVMSNDDIEALIASLGNK